VAGFTNYDLGTPIVTDLWVDPNAGNDANAGTSRSQALRTLYAAWSRLPATNTTTGYRINLVAGILPYDAGQQNYYADKQGTQQYPNIIYAVDGRGTATVNGGLNINNVSHLYLQDVRISAGGAALAWGNNNVHFEASDHVLLRGVTIAGPVPDTGSELREALKVNQCENVFVEDCDIYGGYLTGIDWVTVQGGHILNSSIHDFAGDWATYLKGGTAYIAVAGNEFYNCHLGFSAGQATNFEIMQSPWLHYEVYDIKFVNNVIHDIEGNAVGVQGGYNILIAYNTAYRVAADAAGFGMILLGRGTRGCQDTAENGANNADTICNGFLAAGGWCPAPTNPAGDAMVDDIIPNRNVYVYNNIFYNPAGTQTAYGTLDVHASTTPPAGSQIPSPTLADNNLQIRGNLIYDGGPGHALGVEADGSTGCPAANSACNPTQLAADNAINTVVPALVDPEHGDCRPTATGNVFSATVYAIPAFVWSDAPASPAVPAGTLSNSVTTTADGSARTPDRPGAY